MQHENRAFYGAEKRQNYGQAIHYPLFQRKHPPDDVVEHGRGDGFLYLPVFVGQAGLAGLEKVVEVRVSDQARPFVARQVAPQGIEIGMDNDLQVFVAAEGQQGASYF